MPYTPAIDLDHVSAIDMHVHVEQDDHGCLSLDDELMEASARYFRSTDNRTPTVDDLAERYRRTGMAAVVFTIDARTNLGREPLSSEEIAARASDHADVLVPFGSVDPLRGEAAVDQARSLVLDHGVRGFKFHPSLQGFAPDEERFDLLWATIAELGVPALFHTGQNGIGAGLPGGRGIKLRYSDPMLLDDVAADHPGLTVIMAHPSVPWQAQAISIATHKNNVFIDLSGWSPRYFPEELVRAAGGLLKRKVLFGSDYPLIAPETWIQHFEQLDLRPEVLPLVLKDNAIGVLGLSEPAT